MTLAGHPPNSNPGSAPATLLYGCETWILDTTCLKLLERFQNDYIIYKCGRELYKLCAGTFFVLKE